MNPLALFFDYEPDGTKRPLWVVVDPEEIDWDKPIFYIDIKKAFHKDVYDFQDERIGCSILLEEMLFTVSKPNTIGINLDFIKRRLFKKGIDFRYIQRFIIQAADAKLIFNISQEIYD